MEKRPTIAKYAQARGITLTDAFKEAWKFHFGTKAPTRVIWECVRAYKAYGAVPMFVASFLQEDTVRYIALSPRGLPLFT